ncbi:DUF1801 domain-containing protein [Pedobacter rhizosphaerae]|uniref:YdhG-like domain-containing protein n=1 Tax=Pedobacter rhizosphaerae TaxID=390241 RepID=A0A1H9QBR0_9SPHI|nr:DUF1801 domain-containing protein [Pedobacter rhizosphaerae]SER57904.1 protein of unknown function (DU1801) [Pedobacter rhizosphaerae]
MSINPKVADFMTTVAHPLKEEMEKLIQIISSNPQITSDIKWGGPSFRFKEDMATINPKIKNYVVVVFHKAALLKSDFGFLEDAGKGKSYGKFYSMDDVLRNEQGIKLAVQNWIEIMEQ